MVGSIISRYNGKETNLASNSTSLIAYSYQETRTGKKENNYIRKKS